MIDPRMRIIAAVAANGVIGHGDRIPWTLNGDLPRFRRATLHHVCVVGQTTYRTLPVLAGRTLVVVSRRGNRVVDVSERGVAHTTRLDSNTLSAALNKARWLSDLQSHYWVIGGSQIYHDTIEQAAELHLTHVHATPPGDSWFPPFDIRAWDILESYPCDALSTHAVYRRTP